MIVIIRGHGGNDPGCIHNGVKEVDLNEKISKSCYYEIRKFTKDCIFLNPDKNLTMTIPERAKKLKLLGEKYGKLDVYTMHCDGNIDKNLNGISIIVSKFNTENKNYYYDWMKNFENTFGIKSLKVWKRDYPYNTKLDFYGIHRLSGVNAIVKIFENGFVSNPGDRKILVKNAKEIGIFHAGYILRKNNIKFNKYLYKVQVGAFSILDNAKKLKNELSKKGYESIIKKEEI